MSHIIQNLSPDFLQKGNAVQARIRYLMIFMLNKPLNVTKQLLTLRMTAEFLVRLYWHRLGRVGSWRCLSELGELGFVNFRIAHI
ncbi:hypothetical protein [Giesbergeria anulus]|uniref:hypothetical protein n=1 Tax=Giesbergeria anulus TaxID=180197 RepID=UPI00115FBE31|nr:hypothetical protein [Giesbergeria anulus]